MKILVAQLNPIVGDIQGNLEKLIDTVSCNAEKCDLIVFSELFITGYPPKDLLEKPYFIKNLDIALDQILCFSKEYDVGIIVGTVTCVEKDIYNKYYNSAVFIYKGEVLKVFNKVLLPMYDVFDESRYFVAGKNNNVVNFKDKVIGVCICEDMWVGKSVCQDYEFDPIENLVKKGANLLINISASPFFCEKEIVRYSIIKEHIDKYKIPFLFVNQVGGNDELIFDGTSIFCDNTGNIVYKFPSFKEHVEIIDINDNKKKVEYKIQEKIESVCNALILGIKDYIKKVGFSKVVLGLSGGIDSAVTCVLAQKAIGSSNVLGVCMPSQYTSHETIEYSKLLANNLNINFKVIDISDIYSSYVKLFNEESCDNREKKVEVYLQNIQARIRGNILMFFSNKYGYLLLSTGNKSELAVGYCTLYGDMAGGLCVLSDVPKTMVYALADYINKDKKIIPNEIINRIPSAELSPNQKDQDTLPEYSILDKVLYYYIEKNFSKQEIINLGIKKEQVDWIIQNLKKNEYKRKQASLGLKVTTKAFGTGRRMPIASKY